MQPRRLEDAKENAKQINPFFLRVCLRHYSLRSFRGFAVVFAECPLVVQSPAMSTIRQNRQPLVSPGEIDHHVADMTATIAADVPLEMVQSRLAAKEQWLPIDGDPSQPVGRLVEMNST